MHSRLILSIFGLILTATPALALEELPEILVTAEFRDTRLHDASASISVVDSNTMRESAAQQLEDILNLVPNVNFASGTSRARYFQIRGVGDRSQFQEPLNPSVGVLLDGVDFSGIGSIGTLFDVAQVEVLRGPQGTLHGANALAGLLSIRSEAPSTEPYHRLEAMAGDYNSYSLGAISSGPVNDTVLYRLAAQRYRSDGYQQNDFLHQNDSSDRDEKTLRARLRWLPSTVHTVDIDLNWIDIDNGYDVFSLDNTRHTLSDEPGVDQQQSTALSLQTNSDFALLQLQTTVSYAHTDSDYGYDEDWTFVGFHPDGYSASDLYQRSRDSVSAELRLLSNEQSTLFGGRSGWVAGFYYLGNDEDLDRRYTYAADFDSSYNTDSYALFAEMTSQLSEHLQLITGLRGERRDTDYRDNNAVQFSPDNNLWGGKIALEYDWNENTMVYASVSRGYRANGVNAGILANSDAGNAPQLSAELQQLQEFEEETLLNYELGLKSSLRANTLQARLALFYMDRDEQQVKGSFLIAQADGGTTFIDYTSNAARGNNYGAELEVDWLATEALRLWANIGLLNTEFDNYVNEFGEDLSGRDQAQAPNYQFSTGAHYSFAQGFYLRLAVEGKDAFYFSDRHNAKSDAFTLVNASLGWSNEHWSVSLWGRNLGDEDYYVRGFGSFGNDPRNGYSTEPYYQYGEPRMLGASASYTF